MAFSVDFCELDQYPRGQWNRQGFTGWRKLKVAWADADTLISELMAYPNNIWPTEYYHIGSDYGVLDDIKVEPYAAVSAHASSTSYNSYAWALLTLTYVTRTFGMHNGVLISESYNGGTTAVPMDAEGLSWAGSGLPLVNGFRPSRYVTTGTYSITFHERLVVPTAALSLAGCINNAPWASYFMDMVYGTGTMLMLASQVNRVITSSGSQSWTYGLNFHIHPVGWNYLWDPLQGAYDYLKNADGNAVPLYTSANFGLLR